MIQKIHFIAIGGAVMHNLALSMVNKGMQVTGSDDEIYEPSKTRLQNAGILPQKKGWFPEKITSDLNAVFLGMHARIDNPELIRAQELNIPIYSFPQFVYEQSKDKTRVVISGSHGKTTITSIILHVLKYHQFDFDYLVGAQIQGFDLMVKLSDAPVIIIEGDEYLTSPLDRTPKFFHYHHHILLMSGISWDHYNVFPTFEFYTKQFEKLIEMTPDQGEFIYCDKDETVKNLALKNYSNKFIKTAYQSHPSKILEGQTFLLDQDSEIPIEIFGDHNLQNLQGAFLVLKSFGISPKQFYEAITSFQGAAKRQEILAKSKTSILYRDFAHAPSKLKATVEAVKNQFPKHKLIAVQELHTYSSLNPDFINNYKDTFDAPDVAVVYLNPKAVSLKKLELMDEYTLREGFNRADLIVFTEINELKKFLEAMDYQQTHLLLMSSGNFDDMDLTRIKELINQS